MKIKKVIVKNFRWYKEKTELYFDDLTVFVWKNDIWKSTILEWLDIFFNDKKATVKMEDWDLNIDAKNNWEEDIEISVIFYDFPPNIDLDWWNNTTLENEFLLNKESLLEIKKVYKKWTCKHIYLNALHPNNDLSSSLLSKKQTELKKIVNDNKFTCVNKTLNTELRKSIRDNSWDLKLNEREIEINKEDWKKIWEKIEKNLPVYSLFQSDRSNNDQDNEVQNPLKIAVREIIKESELQEVFKEVSQKITSKINDVAKSTLEKLKEMNPDIANHLEPSMPNYDELKWEDVFKKVWIESDNGIPLNKRWSWVKRLVLLNFFRAEVDRRKKERNVPDVIYAIEEPETSQHPDHQKILINSFIELSKSDNTQILLTTHSPAIAQLLPWKNIKLIHKEGNILKIEEWDCILPKIVETLWALPILSKVVICVEWEYDRKFLLNINENIEELKNIIDISDLSIIPLIWSNLKRWINRDYLGNSSIIEFHLYDRDEDDKYKNAIEIVNQRNDNSLWKLTNNREMENYIHKNLIEKCPSFNSISCSSITDWNNEDIPKFLLSTWIDERSIKEILNGKLAKNMSKELFEELGVWEEVEWWFKDIKTLSDLVINEG